MHFSNFLQWALQVVSHVWGKEPRVLVFWKFRNQRNSGCWFSKKLQIQEHPVLDFWKYWESKNHVCFPKPQKTDEFPDLTNKDIWWVLAWVTQHPTVHHPKNPVRGFHGWDESVPKGAVYMVSSFNFLLGLFSLILCFSQLAVFSPGPPFWFFIFFWATPDPILFFGNSYLPLQPTYYPSSHQLIYLPPPASFCLIPSFSVHLHT